VGVGLALFVFGSVSLKNVAAVWHVPTLDFAGTCIARRLFHRRACGVAGRILRHPATINCPRNDQIIVSIHDLLAAVAVGAFPE
jgi:hypothetical protein